MIERRRSCPIAGVPTESSLVPRLVSARASATLQADLCYLPSCNTVASTHPPASSFQCSLSATDDQVSWRGCVMARVHPHYRLPPGYTAHGAYLGPLTSQPAVWASSCRQTPSSRNCLIGDSGRTVGNTDIGPKRGLWRFAGNGNGKSAETWRATREGRFLVVGSARRRFDGWR